MTCFFPLQILVLNFRYSSYTFKLKSPTNAENKNSQEHASGLLEGLGGVGMPLLKKTS